MVAITTSPLAECPTFPTELMDHRRMTEGIRQAEGVRQLLGEGERLVDVLEGLGRVAQQLHDPGRNGAAPHHGVRRMIQEGPRTVLLGVIEDDAVLQVRAGRGKLAKIGRRRSQRQVRRQAEARVVRALGPLEEIRPELTRYP